MGVHLGPVGLTYQAAGVDIERADALVAKIGALAKKSHGPEVLTGIGGFASLFSIKALLAEAEGMEDPVLVSGTDGVGTKLSVAFAHGVHDTVGIDLVAMCVNDILTTGARPLFFLDYFATGKLDLEVGQAVVAGVAKGCEEAGCALVGGETAELPGLYKDGEYDLAGFAVGLVDRSKIIDGSGAKPGDQVVALLSHGLHSNGYSLARAALLERAGRPLNVTLPGLDVPLGDALLVPTALYTKATQRILRRLRPKAMAHITGGGLPGNLPRVLPAGVTAHLFRGAWPEPAIFGLIQEAGAVETAEMFSTFNMGVGMALVVAPGDVEAVISQAAAAGQRATLIGELRARDGQEPQVKLHEAPA